MITLMGLLFQQKIGECELIFGITDGFLKFKVF